MKILFVCSSNVCRSPYCEFHFKKIVENDPVLANKIEWIKSAAVLNRCKKIHGMARNALLIDGFSEAAIDAHTPALQKDEPFRFEEADIIIGMTESHRFFLKKIWRHKYINLSEAAGHKYKPVPDPWLIRDISKYRNRMSIILKYLQEFAEKLKEE